MVNLRKRKADSSAPSQYAEQGSDENDSQSDDENRAQPQKSAKKRAATPRKGKVAQGPADGDNGAATMDAPLLELVRSHPQALSTAAKDWVEGYQQNRPAATAQLLTLLAQASGCSADVTLDDVDEGEIDKLAKGLLQHVQQDGFEDHFKSKAGKSFRANYLELWDKVMQECQAADILWDNYLLDKVSFLVIALSCSVVRSFRYAATLTACQLVSSWIRTMQTLTEARETAQRQLDAEGKKKTNKAAADRMASFQKVIERSHSQATSLRSCVGNLFQAVSAKRFRDVAPEIRALVIEGIADWTSTMPADFLQDQYLKYIAWALSDRDAAVRETAVTALLELYGDEDNVAAMHDLTERFTPRFATLIHDIDEGVAVKGVQLLTLLVQLEEVPGKQVRDVYKLLLDDSYNIRHAAAELVADMLENSGQRHLGQVGQAAPGKGRKKKGDGQASQQELQLAGLLHIMFLLANDEEEDADLGKRRRQSAAGLRGAEQPLSPVMVAHVVDALFDRVEVLSDWKALSAALLEDTAVEARSDASSSNLVLLLRDAAHKATGGQLVPSRQETRKQGSKARQTAAASHKQDLTLALTQALPDLISKYQTDAFKASALVSMVRDLNLEMYSLKRQESSFQSLMRAVADVLGKHVEADVVAHCARSLVYCTQYGPDAIQSQAQMQLGEVVEEQTQKLAASTTDVLGMTEAELEDAAEAYRSAGGSAAEEDEGLFACRAALLRLHHLQLLSKAPAESATLQTSLEQLVEAAASGTTLGAPITELALLNSFTLLLWQLQTLQQRHKAGFSSSGQTAEGLGKRVATFCAHLEGIYDANEDVQRLRDCIFRIQADLFLLFGTDKLEGGSAEAAGYTPSDETLQGFWEHCQDILSRAAMEVPEPSLDADPEEDQKARAKLEQEAEADNRTKCEAVAAVGRLVAFQSLAAGDWLGPNLLSHMVSHGRQVSDLVKDVCRSLKKNNAAAMPGMYLQAMQVAFQRHLDDDQSQDSVQEFTALCTRVAQTYAGFNASATALLHIAKEGVTYAMEGPPSRLPFLKGLGQVCSRMPARQAEMLLDHVQECVSDLTPNEEDPEWQDYFDFLALTEGRTAKGAQPKSALKDGSTANKAGKRRISFQKRASDHNNEEEHQEDGGSSDHEQVEEEEEQGTPDVIEEDVQPAEPSSSGWKMRARGPVRSPHSGRAPASAPRGLSRFASQMISSPIPSGMQDDVDLMLPDSSANPSLGLEQDSDQVEEDEEDQDEDEEQQEDQQAQGEAEEEDEEEVDVVGSDEIPSMEPQLPGMRGSQPSKPRRGMKRLYPDSSQEPSAAAAPGSFESAGFIDPFGSKTVSDKPSDGEQQGSDAEGSKESQFEAAPRPQRRRRVN